MNLLNISTTVWIETGLAMGWLFTYLRLSKESYIGTWITWIRVARRLKDKKQTGNVLAMIHVRNVARYLVAKNHLDKAPDYGYTRITMPPIEVQGTEYDLSLRICKK